MSSLNGGSRDANYELEKLAEDVLLLPQVSVTSLKRQRLPSEADDRDLSRRRLVDGSQCFRVRPPAAGPAALSDSLTSKVASRCDRERRAETRRRFMSAA